MHHGELIIVSDDSVFNFFLDYHGDEFSKTVTKFVSEFFEKYRHIVDKVHLPPLVYRKIYETIEKGKNGYKSEQQIMFEEIFEESRVVSANDKYTTPKTLNDIYQFHKDDILYSMKKKKVIVLTSKANTEGYKDYNHFMNFEDFYKYAMAEYSEYSSYINTKFFPEPNLPN